MNLDSDGTCGLSAPSLSNAVALLGVLAFNGGPTRTHALLAGSPAIDSADGALCPLSDQRGVLRLGQPCDIGAYEVNAIDISVELNPHIGEAILGALQGYGLTVSNEGPRDAFDVTLVIDPDGGLRAEAEGAQQTTFTASVIGDELTPADNATSTTLVVSASRATRTITLGGEFNPVGWTGSTTPVLTALEPLQSVLRAV